MIVITGVCYTRGYCKKGIGQVGPAAKWVARVDDQGREYYHNPQTGETSWVKPSNDHAAAVAEHEPENQTRT